MSLKRNKSEKLLIQFDEAIYQKSTDAILKKILDQFKASDYSNYALIFDLITDKRFSLLDKLYKEGIPFSYIDCANGNVFHVACGAGGSLDAVKFLFERNIATDVNVCTDEKETPFLLAVMYGHADIVKYLLQYTKPDISIKSVYGDTALSLAEKLDDPTILKLLKDYEKIH